MNFVSGSGSFGDIYIGINTTTNEKYAVCFALLMLFFLVQAGVGKNLCAPALLRVQALQNASRRIRDSTSLLVHYNRQFERDGHGLTRTFFGKPFRPMRAAFLSQDCHYALCTDP